MSVLKANCPSCGAPIEFTAGSTILCSSREFKSRIFVGSLQAEFQRRFRIGNLGDLTQILESTIRPCDCRAAVRTD